MLINVNPASQKCVIKRVNLPRSPFSVSRECFKDTKRAKKHKNMPLNEYKPNKQVFYSLFFFLEITAIL